MCSKTILAVSGATLALAVASPVALAAGATQVTVRVEGKTHTLLKSKRVRTHAGSVTRGGAPRGACPATSAAGALDVATGHHWSATWFSGLDDFEIKRILGDTESTKKFFWAIWVDNRFATTGACEIRLHRGEHLLFAVVLGRTSRASTLDPRPPAHGRRKADRGQGRVVLRQWREQAARRGSRDRRRCQRGHEPPRGRASGALPRRYAGGGRDRQGVHPCFAGSHPRHRLGRAWGRGLVSHSSRSRSC